MLTIKEINSIDLTNPQISFKLYYMNGSFLYNGQYQNNMKNGIGKSYYINGFIEYSGEFKDNLPHGNGTMYSIDGYMIYNGEFKFNKKDGKRNI